MASDVIDVSTLTVEGTSIGLSSASPTKAAAFLSGARQALIIVEDAPVYMRSDGDAATSADVLLNVGDAVQVLTDNPNKTLDNLRFIRKTSTSATLKITWYSRDAILTGRIIRGSVRVISESGGALDHAEDVAHVSGDTGIMPLTVRKDTATALAGTDGDYAPFESDASGRLHVVNSDIEKAEDAAHSSGDKGIMALGVRQDIQGSLASATGDYTPPQFDNLGNLRVLNDDNPLFGQPEIRCDNEGWGQWERKALQAKYKDSYDTNRHFRYGNWAVHLNGGPQASEESWASVSVPIKSMRVQDIASIAYDWYAQYNGSAHILDVGPNLVWSAYDPADHSKRVDFNTYGIDNTATRPVTAGIYNYKLTSTDATERVYWYGNNCTGTDTAPAEGADGYWSQYITDALFKDWIVYRLQIMHGYWGATRSAGDVWIMNLRINDNPVKWEPTPAEKVEIEKRDAAYFGEVTLQSANNGSANWCQGMVSPLDQKSPTGWLACLYGGVQTNDDWARVNIPVNEMPLVDLKTAMWTYYMSAAESMGVNMVIWVHDPFNPDNRAEITQLANIATLEKANAWNKHVLNPSTDQFFYYGGGTTNTNLAAGPANLYGLDDFIADELFNTWRIYRITLEYGWESGSNEFTDAWVADIKINGEVIPLKPDKSGTGRIAHRLVNVDTGALAYTIAPKTPYRLISVDIHASAVLDTGEVFTITKDAGAGTFFDTLVYSDDLFIGSRTSQITYFGDGYDFPAEDELDFAQANGSNDDIGLTITYQTVFA